MLTILGYSIGAWRRLHCPAHPSLAEFFGEPLVMHRGQGLLVWFVLLLGTIGALGPKSYATPSPSTLTLLGDSILQQMATVQRSLPASFSGAMNLGVAGYVVAQIGSRVSAIPSTATHVVIEGGVNNLLQGSAADIVPGYAAMLQSIPSNMRVIVVGIMPVDEAALRPGWLLRLVDNTKIAALNAQIASVCVSFPNCVPASSVMSMNMTRRTVDGIHLKATTYQEWAALLTPSLVAESSSAAKKPASGD
jgi:lysophospholipase L1-like esterase